MASIRVVETKQNFKPIIKALSIFDKAMNGGQLRDGNSKKKAMDKSTERLLFGVVSFLCGDINIGDDGVHFDQYVQNTLHIYKNHKTTCNLDIHRLSDNVYGTNNNKKCLSLLMNRIEGNDIMSKGVSYYLDGKGEEVAFKSAGDLTNLFTDKLFKIFTRINTLIITATGGYRGSDQYPFSLLSLLELIKSTSLKKIVIKATVYSWEGDKDNIYFGSSWLDILFGDDNFVEREEIKTAFKKLKYTINIQKKCVTDPDQTWCTIQKI